MPRVIINSASPSSRYEKLVQKLATELTSPGGAPQPLIVERILRASDSRHVHVIWDEWGDLDGEERSAVITQAYAKVEGEGKAANLSVALGLRPEDAILYGLLPFKVMPKRPGDVERTDHRQAFAEEAGRTLLGKGARELRYPTFEEAEQAVKRMKKHVPRTAWAVVREADEGE